MADAEGEGMGRLAAVAAALSRQPGVELGQGGSKLFGHSALTVNGKIFAMVSSNGQFVVKLPKARVDALVAGFAGQHFEVSEGRPTKEWLEVHSQSRDEWLQLAREALTFVAGLE